MTILGISTVKARKAHGCDLCCGGINPGELYERQTSVSDGAWDSFLACARCTKLMHAWFDHVNDRDEVGSGTAAEVEDELEDVIGREALDAILAAPLQR